MKTKIFLTVLSILTILQIPSTAQKLQLDKEFKLFNERTKQQFEQVVINLAHSLSAEDKAKLQNAKAHLSHGNYFQFKETADLPKSLNWQSGNPQPIIGDERAKKGGVANLFHSHPPQTLRSFGPDANSAMRGILFDTIDLSLLYQHPVTEAYMPSIASAWALSEDKKTAYFKINKSATYSDGVQVETVDFLVSVLIRCHDYSQSPYHKYHYPNIYLGFTLYGDTLAVHLAKRYVDPLFMVNLQPMPKHFYQDFDQDFVTKYDRKFPPTTGAYLFSSKDSNAEKTVQNMVPKWWAKNLPQFKYAFNADKIIYHHTQDKTNALEAGLIDIAQLSATQKSDKIDEEIKNGVLKVRTFQHQAPTVPRGFYLNTTNSKLKDVRVREAIQYSFDIESALKNTETLGTVNRLNQFSEGYGKYTNANIVARVYSKKKSSKLFIEAGYHKSDAGYWVDKNGERVSLTVTYAKTPNISNAQLMRAIQFRARDCGVDIKLKALDQMILFKQTVEKKFEIVYFGWGVTGPHPHYHQFFHSSNAYNPDGSIRLQTNNINGYSSPELDDLITKYKFSFEPKEHIKLAHQIQQHIHDAAIFIPAYKTSSVDIIYKNTIQWPNSNTTKFSLTNNKYPIEDFLWWVDSEL